MKQFNSASEFELHIKTEVKSKLKLDIDPFSIANALFYCPSPNLFIKEIKQIVLDNYPFKNCDEEMDRYLPHMRMLVFY